MADVIFPASSFLEKEGTFTNGERRIQGRFSRWWSRSGEQSPTADSG
ncbi:MAG: molybdopterin-dependent oxidoreductase [Bacteroidales bacterium]